MSRAQTVFKRLTPDQQRLCHTSWFLATTGGVTVAISRTFDRVVVFKGRQTELAVDHVGMIISPSGSIRFPKL